MKRVARGFQSERARVADERIHRVVNEKIRWTREGDRLPAGWSSSKGTLEGKNRGGFSARHAVVVGHAMGQSVGIGSFGRATWRAGLGILGRGFADRAREGPGRRFRRGTGHGAILAGADPSRAFRPTDHAHSPLYDQWNTFGAKTFSPESREILERLWPDYQALFPSVDFARETHLLFVRVGYAPPMRWASPRFSPDQVLSFSQESQ
ncbi:MAG: hypothetical protein IPN23_11200 [Elusimicrobia bacterium]|nr:hypothetical protein [Elusimicrobiota bacterium]